MVAESLGELAVDEVIEDDDSVEEDQVEVADVDGCSQVLVDSGVGFTWGDEECLSLWTPQWSLPSPRSMTPAKAGAAKARRARVPLTILDEWDIIAIPRTQR